MFSDQHLHKLTSINSIERLLDFLRQELDWPLADGDVESLTFEYEPEDLGLKPEHAPKINRIYQIRSMTKDQPWGIFFIDFENKKLPITLMRRILNHLRVKNRSQAIQSWNAGDLLFMTTYGEEAEGMREVAFAHFHQQAGDLPTLNVFQWDAQDTEAKLKTTYQTLRGNLGWPADINDADAWRNQWRQPFKHKAGHTIRTAKGLAEKLAELSRQIRDRVNEVLAAETEKGPVTKLYVAFKGALIHDLKSEDFADTFAQTITYGLFSAAVSRRYPEEAGSKSLTTETITEVVPETSPFLREVLLTFLDVGGRKKGGIDFDELGIQDVVELLRSDETDMRAILEDFGNRRQGEDPVIHFYEDYLKAYNRNLKIKRGVFYTPQPVVSYIVRSVNELLQTEFGIEDGLASTVTWGDIAAKNPAIKIPEGTSSDDPFVVILDPATGTATFLIEVIDVIHKHLKAKWKASPDSCWAMLRDSKLPQDDAKRSFDEFWNAYVPDYLLRRLYGYELMMAPYAIAHVKVGLKLTETGYRFPSNQRVRIYLTNALEPASEVQARLALDWEALAHEAMAVRAVKETQRFTVVIGNPPYSNFGKLNRIPFILELLNDYKIGLNEKKINLNDDYIKFIRVVQYLVDQSGSGVVGFITNNSYFDGLTHRQMRRCLMNRFSKVCILDLHGNSSAQEKSADGTSDENVFDIQQGVGVIICSTVQRTSPAYSHASLLGTRVNKYQSLTMSKSVSNLMTRLIPLAPMWFFVNGRAFDDSEYLSFASFDSVFIIRAYGIQSKKDELFVDLNRTELESRMKQVLTLVGEGKINKAVEDFDLNESSGWSCRKLHNLRYSENSIRQVLYRPFDMRWIYYDRKALGRARFETLKHMLRRNQGLIVMRQVFQDTDSYSHFGATRLLIDERTFYSNRGGTYLAPLYSESASPNLHPVFLDLLAVAVGRRFEDGGYQYAHGGILPAGGSLFEPQQPTLEPFGQALGTDQGTLENTSVPSFTPEDVFHYIYAVLHSPTYRSRYAEFLKIDFPRIPLPGGPEVFDALVPLGGELVALHLMESPCLNEPMTTFIGQGAPQVEKVSYTNQTVWINKDQTKGFQGVPESVWNFHIGGYQVCEKWLKDRGPKKGKPGRTLTPEDIDHYHRIVVALSETIRIMAEIDKAIEAHGGWPGAFQGAGP